MLFHAIGLMSGTSLDGLDICNVQFEKTADQWKFEIRNAETLPYTVFWEQKLRTAAQLSAEDLLELHSEYGFFLGKCVQDFVEKHHLQKVDLVASHGHTIFHQPKRKFTLQIGDGRALKTVCRLPVIYDFRMQDVLLGGNGAPLVPIGDQLLFSEFDACLNIGGFSNISFTEKGKRIAFDICPVNIVLNAAATKLGKNYDENGDLARIGEVNEQILEQLNGLDFYKISAPKSLGAEWVEEHFLPLMQSMKPEDQLATLTHHAAQQITRVLRRFNLQKVLVTGGGSYNFYLMELLQNLSESEIITPEKKITEFKEALIFAFMGVLRMNGENNVLSSATGSEKDHSSGVLA